MKMFDKGEKQDQFYAFPASQFSLKKTYKKTEVIFLKLIHYIPKLMIRLTHETESKTNEF